jgi:hypothetical protein
MAHRNRPVERLLSPRPKVAPPVLIGAPSQCAFDVTGLRDRRSSLVQTQAVDAAWSKHLGSTIEILERQRDRLISLVAEGPVHLRSLRLRQLKSIEQRLAAVQAEEHRVGYRSHQGRDVVPALAYDLACRPLLEAETMLGWIVVYRNPIPGGPALVGPESKTKEAALSRARSYENAGHQVYRIQGPEGEVIGKEEIDRWIAVNPIDAQDSDLA